jgi:hypothetical protein
MYVKIQLSYELNDRNIRVRLPSGAAGFSAQSADRLRARLASYPVTTWGCFPLGKETGA